MNLLHTQTPYKQTSQQFNLESTNLDYNMTSSNQHTPVRVNTSFRLRSCRSAPSANTPARMTSLFLQETAQLMRDPTLNASRQQIEIAQLSVRPENEYMDRIYHFTFFMASCQAQIVSLHCLSRFTNFG